jgi:thiol-disulfide isomerase/thioredoxin
MVGIVVAGLALRAAALTWVAPSGGVEINREAPDFKVMDLVTRDTVSLSDYRGSVTLVNIWATWCLPCRDEMPSMQALYDSLAGRGFRIAAISIDEGSPEEVVAFAQKFGLTRHPSRPERDCRAPLSDYRRPRELPLDRRGVLVKRVIGAHDWSRLPTGARSSASWPSPRADVAG